MLKDELDAILKSGSDCIHNSSLISEIEKIRVELLGKKGKLTNILKQMGKLQPEERPLIGKLANEVRDKLENLVQNKLTEIKSKQLTKQIEEEKLDVTLPGKICRMGKRHPLNTVLSEIEEIFIAMGFKIKDGPEVEYSRYNFDALNIPKDHVARDEQDTFYINDDILLRTQTSSVQIRVMENEKPPIRIIAPGRVYRADTVDATHSPLFHQIEGLVVDKNISFSDLKGTLEIFVKELFGENTVVRFRPHHFHFTEPSAELDMQCFACKGEGCPLCKGEGWIEILGCGMVHPKVLSNCGIDPEIYSGFAFGMGLERLVMRRYNINDLRLFFENDIRFLKQF